MFGVSPRFERILREESSPMVVSDRSSSGTLVGGQVPALEGTPIQDADGGGTVDTEVRGVNVVREGNISLVKESKLFFLCLSPLFVTFFFLFWSDVETPVLMEEESVAHAVSAAASSSQT